MARAKKVMRWTLPAVLIAANLAFAATLYADSGWFDRCKYGIPPWGGPNCAEYCSNVWGGCGGSCIDECNPE